MIFGDAIRAIFALRNDVICRESVNNARAFLAYALVLRSTLGGDSAVFYASRPGVESVSIDETLRLETRSLYTPYDRGWLARGDASPLELQSFFHAPRYPMCRPIQTQVGQPGIESLEEVEHERWHHLNDPGSPPAGT